jgi:hypothetical protein
MVEVLVVLMVEASAIKALVEVLVAQEVLAEALVVQAVLVVQEVLEEAASAHHTDMVFKMT